eukprot:m.246766 g.246766  ORF g.246766 m.246766 type:complete len:67 (-) comp54475_c0_seq5:673-873(-)
MAWTSPLTLSFLMTRTLCRSFQLQISPVRARLFIAPSFCPSNLKRLWNLCTRSVRDDDEDWVLLCG